MIRMRNEKYGKDKSPCMCWESFFIFAKKGYKVYKLKGVCLIDYFSFGLKKMRHFLWDLSDLVIYKIFGR